MCIEFVEWLGLAAVTNGDEVETKRCSGVRSEPSTGSSGSGEDIEKSIQLPHEI